MSPDAAVQTKKIKKILKHLVLNLNKTANNVEQSLGIL
jgi:hypothetical protein